MDMIAHNNDHEKDVFQIAPGTGATVDAAGRSGPRGERNLERLDGQVEPSRRPPRPVARQAQPRTATRYPTRRCTCRSAARSGRRTIRRSPLYNTDGQIFSDAGVPVVLFMENYDINRQGYHDTHDTMENIDLDYGAALSAIAIETVAKAGKHDRGREGRLSRPPLPPNRTGGSPASGFPVDGVISVRIDRNFHGPCSRLYSPVRRRMHWPALMVFTATSTAAACRLRSMLRRRPVASRPTPGRQASDNVEISKPSS